MFGTTLSEILLSDTRFGGMTGVVSRITCTHQYPFVCPSSRYSEVLTDSGKSSDCRI